MVQLDTLSRRPDYGAKGKFDDEEKTMLPKNLFINLLDMELQERILNRKDIDLDVKKAMESLLEEGPTNLQNNLHNWKVEEIDGKWMIFYKEKNYILKDQEWRWDIIRMYHDHKTAGHPGELETYNRVRQHYWWPGLQMFVKNYVQGCGVCQQFKINQSPSKLAYIAIKGVNTTRPFARCSLDLITNLPPVEGYDSTLVMVDRGLSKGVILCPCVRTITWEGTSDGATKRVN
jgi:Integrase zinc binding domain